MNTDNRESPVEGPSASGRLAEGLKTAAAIIGPLIVILGFGFYIILKLSYEIYYGTFGVAPEDVGLSYPAIVAQSGTIVAGTLTLAALLSVGALTINHRMGSLRHRTLIHKLKGPIILRSQDRPSAIDLEVIAVGTGCALVAALLMLLGTAPVSAMRFGERAQEGNSVENQGLRPDRVFSPDQPWLLFRSVPTTVVVANNASPTLKRLELNTNLRYLGQTNQIIVIYDHRAREVIRTPVNMVSLITKAPSPSGSSDSTLLSVYALTLVLPIFGLGYLAGRYAARRFRKRLNDHVRELRPY